MDITLHLLEASDSAPESYIEALGVYMATIHSALVLYTAIYFSTVLKVMLRHWSCMLRNESSKDQLNSSHRNVTDVVLS